MEGNRKVIERERERKQLESASQKGNWYIFNDKNVFPCGFDSLSNLFDHDVPYMLFYRRVRVNDDVNDVGTLVDRHRGFNMMFMCYVCVMCYVLCVCVLR